MVSKHIKDVQHHYLLVKLSLKPQWNTTAPQPECIRLKKLTIPIPSLGDDVEQLEYLKTAVGSIKCHKFLEKKCLTVPLKVQHKSTNKSRHSTLRYISKKTENTSTKACVRMFVMVLLAIFKKWKQPNILPYENA